jgi:N-acetylmuramoyl-L-alanine amidase
MKAESRRGPVSLLGRPRGWVSPQAGLPTSARFIVRIIRALALGLAACLLAVGAASAGANPAVTGVRMGVDSQRTRVVLDLSAPVKAETFLLTSPYRLVIDLPKVDWKAPVEASGGAGLVKGYRFGQFDAKTSRFVLELTGPVEIANTFSLAPNSGYQNRFVVDIKAASPTSANVAENQPDLSTGAAGHVPAPMRKPRPLTLTVVIDPGHGGVDPGTIGVGGTKEKNVVLAVGRKLRDELKKEGYHVIMTRHSDKYLPLRQRVAIARNAHADMFISLHADTNNDPKFRGASVYTLSDKASDKAAAKLARKENGVDMIGGVDISDESQEVSSILVDLTMRETMNESARFARMVTPDLGRVMPLVNKAHRFAGFVVLKDPDVPSVLVELGQLSNKADEKRLTQPKSQAAVANALAHAVDQYFQPEQRADLR